MANTRSAEKRNRQAQKRRERNAAVKTAVKTALRKAREALAAKDVERARSAVQEASSSLSRAASKGVLHTRNASRRIARLNKTLSGMGR